MDIKSIERLELNKVLDCCAEYACLEGTKKILGELLPVTDLSDAREALSRTGECLKLLFRYGLSGIKYFSDVEELLVRASKRSVLSCAELRQVNELLRSARMAYTSINSVDDDEIVKIKGDSANIYFDKNLEDDITEKIISDDEVWDHASAALYSIRSRIKSLNERIRSKLSEYVTGETAKYLQDGIVTMRGDRYVIPVKAEYRSRVKGLVHDRSQTGATFFVEPEYVLELNNELVALQIDEREEVERILKELSAAVGNMSERLKTDIRVLSELESYYARAQYCYANKCVRPQVNKRGYINIIKGRHPLIDREKVVPVSVELGGSYNFLLISGANTGGKTVTLKMCGLFCLMAACGMYISAAEGSSVCIFDDIFCDVGDSQSIEESLSTFSSHITAVIDMCKRATPGSFVLIDELGGGTNPDEGQALAKAVVEYLLKIGCRGIVTTHFTPLKEFAYTVDGIENASMEFDASTLKPLYSIKIGLPGASNALAICRRLGMDDKILQRAVSFLSEGGKAFENIVRRAEDSRIEADKKLQEANELSAQLKIRLAEVNKKIDELERQREKLTANARAESRRIINERTAMAEELLDEMEELFRKEELGQADLIKARTLKNKLKDAAYGEERAEEKLNDYEPATADNLHVGDSVYFATLGSVGQVLSVNAGKGEAEVLCGSIKTRCKISALQKVNISADRQNKREVRLRKSGDFAPSKPELEINLLGMTVPEALSEVDNFIDRAVLNNLKEIKVIHGVGTGKLREAISAHLRRHKNVSSFRLGKYGEGETGVTIITLK